MLQYITREDSKYSIAEQCQMFIEGGGAWIQLHVPDADDSMIRELASELIPLCRETSTILMLENRPELAKELGLHGLHITLDSGLDASFIRESFGPEAIIGVEVTEASSIVALDKADIDYVTLPAFLSEEKKAGIVRLTREADCNMPIVFEGDFSLENVEKPLILGASGICTGKHIIEAHDPVEYTEKLIGLLRNFTTT